MKGNLGIKIHQALSFSKLFTCANKAPNAKTKYIFFPGCSLSSYSPKTVQNILEHLNNKLGGEVGSILKCCGTLTKSLESKKLFQKRFNSILEDSDKIQGEIFILACPSCVEIFEKHSTKKFITLWELLPQIGLPESVIGIGKNSDVKFNIFDSCRVRGHHEIYDGVRWVVNELGYKIEELENSKDKSKCCGFGLFIDSKATRKVMTKRAEETTTGYMLTYCGACREAMEIGGTDSQHILDLVFGDTYTSSKAKNRNQNTITKWLNRYRTRRALWKK